MHIGDGEVRLRLSGESDIVLRPGQQVSDTGAVLNDVLAPGSLHKNGAKRPISQALAAIKMIAFNLIAPQLVPDWCQSARLLAGGNGAGALLIVGLLAAVFLPATNTLLDNNRRKETRAKLEALEQKAMVRFVMVNRRLPCPADGEPPCSGVEQRNQGWNWRLRCMGLDQWGFALAQFGRIANRWMLG